MHWGDNFTRFWDIRLCFCGTKFFGGRDAALRRPDGAARRPYQGKRRILSCARARLPRAVTLVPIALAPAIANNLSMLALVLSAAVNGIKSFPVEVEIISGWCDPMIVLITSISPVSKLLFLPAEAASSSVKECGGRRTKFFNGRGVALRRPDGAARRPYQRNEEYCRAPERGHRHGFVLTDYWPANRLGV